MKLILNGKEEGEIESAIIEDSALSVVLVEGDSPDPSPDPDPTPTPDPTPDPPPIPSGVRLVHPITMPGQGLVNLNIPANTIFASSFTIPEEGQGTARFIVEDRSDVGIDLWISETPGGEAIEGNSSRWGRGLMTELPIIWGRDYRKILRLDHGKTYYINTRSYNGKAAWFYRTVAR